MDLYSFTMQSLLIIPIIFFIIIYIYLRYIFSYWKRKGVPTLTPSIPFGNFQKVIFGQECPGESIANMYKELKSKGCKFGGFYALTEPNFLVLDPELLKLVFIKNYDSFTERGMHYDEESDPLSAHLVALRNPKWQFLRKTFSPTFTPSKMRMMYPTILACGREMVAVLEKPSRIAAAIDIQDILARFTTDVIGSCAFGLECNSLRNPEAEFRKYGKKFFTESVKHSAGFILALSAPNIVKFWGLSIIDPSITKFFIKAIKDTVDYREKNKVERQDMMNLLIKIKNNETIDAENENNKESDIGITFNDLAAQAFIFFIGGFENSSSTLTFSLYELALNQDIQNKLRNEILKVLKKYDGELTYDAIMEMNYLENVLQETLRKYPTIPVLNRECTKTFLIPGTNISLEKGTRVVISALGIQRDPEYFDDPEVYDPERFNEKRKGLIKPFTYIPWGMGPRNCIGARFGSLTAKIGLAILIQNYKFTIDAKTELPLSLNPKSFVLAFKGTLWLQATKIQL